MEESRCHILLFTPSLQFVNLTGEKLAGFHGKFLLISRQ